ncbi:hypothetical protein WDU94_002004 [Cyamophila willieti]
MCLLDNENFCDKFFDYNKFKESNEIDGLKFDIDQFLNEMSNANLTNDTSVDPTNTELYQHHQSSHVNNQISNSAESSTQLSNSNIENHVTQGDGSDKSNFIWNEVNSMNQLFNINQMNLLQTNVILEESSRDSQNQVDKLNALFNSTTDNIDDKKTVSTMEEEPSQSDPNLSSEFDRQSHSFENKLLKNSQYENLYQSYSYKPIGNSQKDKTSMGSSKSSSSESTKSGSNKLKMFKEKQNKFKNQRLKKLQILTMNKKFEEHLFLDETRREAPNLGTLQNNAYGIAILKNGGDFGSNKRQNDQQHTEETNSKHARRIADELSNAHDDFTNPQRGRDLSRRAHRLTDELAHAHDELSNPHRGVTERVQNLSKHAHRDSQQNADADGEGFSNKCSYCPRVFKMKGSLMIHLKVAHLGKLKSSPSTSSSKSSELKSSVTVASPPQQTFSCTLCSKTFKKVDEFRFHTDLTVIFMNKNVGSDKMHKCEFGSQGKIVKTQNPLIEKLLAKSREHKMAAGLLSSAPTQDIPQDNVLEMTLDK